MLAIRLQRIGRKGTPVYRIAVQEAQRHPSSGKVVAYVGSYNPHTKAVKIDAEKVAGYLKNGAQPTPRVVSLLKAEKIELPAWVKDVDTSKSRATRHPEKLRRNNPAEEVEETPEVAEVVEEAEAEAPAEAPAETVEEAEAPAKEEA